MKASLLVLAVVLAFAITACEEAPVAPPDPPTKIEPPDTFPPELDTKPVFERRVDRIEVPIPPPGTNALNLPVITPLPGARGGNGALVYTAEGLPGDFEIVFGRDLMVVLPGRGGWTNLVGRPDVAGAGEYPIIYTVHDSDENRMVEDSDVMLFVLVIFAIPPAGPPRGVLRNCPYPREADEANFNILVQFERDFDPWLQDEVNCAAAYWENAITADIGAPVSPRGYVGGCSAYGDRYTGRDVDDLMIVVHFESLRAPISPLPPPGPAATSWACEEREGVGLPVTARIAFEASSERYDLPRIAANPDVNVVPGILDEDLDFLFNLARHEIGHALGFGASTAFASHVSAGAFEGQNAVAAHGGPVLLNAGVHWARLRQDIMYPRLFSDQVATRVTLGAMDDIGYTVDYVMAGR